MEDLATKEVSFVSFLWPTHPKKHSLPGKSSGSGSGAPRVSSTALMSQLELYLKDNEPGKNEVEIFINGERYQGGALPPSSKPKSVEEVITAVETHLDMKLKQVDALDLKLDRKETEPVLQSRLSSLSTKGRAADSSASTQAPDWLFPREFTEENVGFSRSARPDWRSVALQLFMEIGGTTK
jgi:hypothetical protein